MLESWLEVDLPPLDARGVRDPVFQAFQAVVVPLICKSAVGNILPTTAAAAWFSSTSSAISDRNEERMTAGRPDIGKNIQRKHRNLERRFSHARPTRLATGRGDSLQ